MYRIYIKGWRSRLPESEDIEYLLTNEPSEAERWYVRVAAETFAKDLAKGATLSLNGSEVTCSHFAIEETSPGVFVIYFESPVALSS